VSKPFKFRPTRSVGGFLTNKERANAGEAAIDAFRAHVRESDPDKTANVVDLVSDLLHWCDRKKLDAEAVLRMARMHWESER
jgi:hypothetical protein